MAALDKVLQIMMARQMECLVLEPGCKPRLRKDGTDHDASPAALDANMVQALLGQLAPADSFDGNGATKDVEFPYQLDGKIITFRCSKGPQGWRAVASEGDAAPELGAPPKVTDLAAESGSNGKVPSTTSPQVVAQPAPLPVEAPASAPSVNAPSPPTSAGTKVSAGGDAAVRDIPQLLDRMLALDASDLHLSSSQPIRMRVHGDLSHQEAYEVVTPERMRELIFAIAPERNQVEFEERRDTDFAYEMVGKARFRVNVFEDRFGIAAVFRLIPHQIPTFQELGLPGVLRQVSHLSKGLVLVTGPTGSGKSTTLAALVNQINDRRRDHIITIEDPIEFVHPSKKCLVHQREVGVHTKSFSAALRAALREDPDIVLVGELRDLETTSTAIETAETGHLVLATLHTTTAPGTVQRLIDQFPGERQAQIRVMLSESLFGVVTQTLLKKKGGGMVAAYEVLVNTPAVANLIREAKTFQIPSAMQVGRKEGMILLNDSLMDLIEKDLVEPAEAYIKAVDKQDLEKRIKALGRELNLGEETEDAEPAKAGIAE